MPKATAANRIEPLIRKAAAADLSAVERIECEQFSNPWNKEYYAAELANRVSHFYVAEEPCRNALVGYMLFWRLAGELELHKIAVAAAWQRQGYASRLMDFFVRTGRSWECERALLEVRASNTPAVRLYEKYAFRLVGRRNKYYDRPVEDALIFELVF
jgi:ribosomal-protein-alanine N-acetyltransferase